MYPALLPALPFQGLSCLGLILNTLCLRVFSTLLALVLLVVLPFAVAVCRRRRRRRRRCCCCCLFVWILSYFKTQNDCRILLPGSGMHWSWWQRTSMRVTVDFPHSGWTRCASISARLPMVYVFCQWTSWHVERCLFFVGQHTQLGFGVHGSFASCCLSCMQLSYIRFRV